MKKRGRPLARTDKIDHLVNVDMETYKTILEIQAQLEDERNRVVSLKETIKIIVDVYIQEQ
jgi:hypothetical protein